jgi:hypothetical protein
MMHELDFIRQTTTGGFRTLVDPADRMPGEVITYKISKEEIEKRYGPAVITGKRPITIPNGKRNRKKAMEKVTKPARKRIGSRIIEICKEHGTDINKLVEVTGLKPQTIRKYLVRYHIVTNSITKNATYS